MYVKTIGLDEATGDVADIYRQGIESRGFLMESDACWTAVPGLLPMVEKLLQTSRANFTLGLLNWRLITLVAAKQVPSTYCSLVYSGLLAAELGQDQTLAIQKDFRTAGLSEKVVAMLAYAEQVAQNASKITEDTIAHLREHGFNDVEIAEIAYCASLRCFLSRYFDAVGATPESVFFDPDPDFRNAMMVGKQYPVSPKG